MSGPKNNQWKTLDRDLGRLNQLELATQYCSRPLVGPFIALVFLLVAGTGSMFFFDEKPSLIIVAAAIFGGYMALNIGANDVANNMGPAFGANALTMGGAILIAAVAESAGALLAGGEVVGTISKGIIEPSSLSDPEVFVWAMMAALISSALWVNLATFVGAPVSTTHSVVGGVMGAGISAAGFASVNWSTMSKIAASWVISPVLGGVIAALFLSFIKKYIIYQDDKIDAARRLVPVLIGIMAAAFATYLALKGLKRIIKIDFTTSLFIGTATGLIFYAISRPAIRKQSEGLENRNKSLKVLFTIPLIFSAALLSFAHGANDVANAVGPLAAIVHAIEFEGSAAKVAIPIWVMVIGAFGISFGLFLFGPKLIRMVGNQITKLNSMRAFCVALSAAITVIVASWAGLPVSSTHIAVGAVFGVGFYREIEAERRVRQKRALVKVSQLVAPEERKRRKLVRRSHFITIISAWVVTVPATAVLSGVIFLILDILFL